MSQTSCRSSSSPTWYHNLPSEILVRIFEHLEESEIRKSVMLVCRQWKFAATRPVLWKKLHIYGERVPTNFICQRIRCLPYLTTIHLREISEPAFIIRQIMRWLPKLKHFTLRNSGTVSETVLRNLIQRCRQLETLDISGTTFRGCKFYEEIAGLMNLRHINLSKNYSLNINNFMTALVNCHKLEELKVTTVLSDKETGRLSDTHVLFIISNFANNLTGLGLDASSLTDFSFKVVTQCTKLKTLSLHNARNLSPEVLLRIWKSLQNLNTLKVREANQIDGSTIAELFNSNRENLLRVTSIDLTGCWKINDAGIAAIANCRELERLRLKGCKSIQSLRPIRDSCTKLKKLNIAFCINLDPWTILPLPEKLNKLILDKSSRFSPIRHSMFAYDHVMVKVCLSEYNRSMENYTCH
ncbi:hypothetical protein PPYR_09467 [Photinus pyralis]|uniref:F-box domain-containing protein n=1 Tax=Photinus pyralis TaxID=7054 RepID=A0A5N4AMD7_PHOPY|nr:F-box/LRR-repeat protein 7-like [Photinus pyralis]KAB0798474.1 hypothetical protein PPYR_09467 [Photinus pyralis]